MGQALVRRWQQGTGQVGVDITRSRMGFAPLRKMSFEKQKRGALSSRGLIVLATFIIVICDILSTTTQLHKRHPTAPPVHPIKHFLFLKWRCCAEPICAAGVIILFLKDAGRVRRPLDHSAAQERGREQGRPEVDRKPGADQPARAEAAEQGDGERDQGGGGADQLHEGEGGEDGEARAAREAEADFAGEREAEGEGGEGGLAGGAEEGGGEPGAEGGVQSAHQGPPQVQQEDRDDPDEPQGRGGVALLQGQAHPAEHAQPGAAREPARGERGPREPHPHGPHRRPREAQALLPRQTAAVQAVQGAEAQGGTPRARAPGNDDQRDGGARTRPPRTPLRLREVQAQVPAGVRGGQEQVPLLLRGLQGPQPRQQQGPLPLRGRPQRPQGRNFYLLITAPTGWSFLTALHLPVLIHCTSLPHRPTFLSNISNRA